jgi:hypothetical protein
MFVGVFVGAFMVEMLRRNSPELSEAIHAKARRLARVLPRALGFKGQLGRGTSPTAA